MKNLIVVVFILFSGIVHADVFDEISAALKTGDSKSLSKFFSNTVDLTIVNQEEVYSKVQAEQILRDFFNKNTPKSFSIIHQGLSKEGARYAIGSLVTSQGITYRTYFFVKQQGNTFFIQELRFMRE